MSRIGRQPVVIPAGVKFSMDGNRVKVEGPKGTLERTFSDYVSLSQDGNVVTVSRKDDSKVARSMHGLFRQLLNNMFVGVSVGYTTNLVINGVGYKAEMKGSDILVLSLGYSTIIEYMIPKGIKITLDGATKIAVFGIDKEQVGRICAEIRSLRKPEPYKGKGIKYEKETIRRKVGKTSAKK